MKAKRLIAGLLCVALLAAGLGGCGSTASDKTTAAGLPQAVTIGTQQMPDDEGIAKAKGYLEKEMGVPVRIVEFKSGKDVNNALLSKSIDFGLLGSSPATLAIANKIPVKLIWVHEVLGEIESLAVKDSAGIQSIQDLRGKVIATPFASTSHYSLLRALEKNNLSAKDLTLLDMQPADIFAAWQRGNLDGAYVWQPVLGQLLQDGKILLSSEDMAGQGVVTANVELVRTEFAEKYPDLVVKYIRAMEQAVDFYNQQKQQAVQTVATALNLSKEDAQVQMEGSIWLTGQQQLDPAYMGTSSQKGALAGYLKDSADFLVSQQDLLQAPDAAAFGQAIDPSYIEKSLQEGDDSDD